MARIKELSPQEAQKIAAGEVVERPANVVKELIENSLDAGATQIAVYITDAGKSLIRIIDNGCGMCDADAHLCFKHHATSKLTTVDDLPMLATFGFRGEALSSIASVSKVTLITKEPDAPQAIKLTLEQGKVISNEYTAATTGTDIAIENLFYNVPARKKFLKSTDTEWRQIMLLFQAFCLDYLSVHFKLFSNNSLHYNCPPVTEVSQRAAQLWDHTIAQQTIAIETKKENLAITGIISNHTYARYDRSSIFFFVNRRWVKNFALSKALMKGYMNVLQPDKFPLACINISVNPTEVDINIHPRKEEVQFLHPRIIEQLLQTTVKEALEKHLSAQLNKKVSFAEPASHFQGRYIEQNGSIRLLRNHSPRTDLNTAFSPTPFVLSSPQSGRIEGSEKINPIRIEESSQIISDPLVLPVRHSLGVGGSVSKHSSDLQTPQSVTHPTEYHILGQFHKTYILIEQEDSLFLVDQHAAHERILYELFAHRFQDVATIGLLFPPIIHLTPDEFSTLEPHLEIFKDNHITLEIIGNNQLMIQAVPVHLKEVDLTELVHQTIGWITESQKIDPLAWHKKVHEKLHAQMACKAAIKAGDILTMTQMQQLLADLEKTNNRFTCPHGRPTGWNLSLYEIEKKFKRKM